MQIQQVWPLLAVRTRSWLIEHNGEPLDPHVEAELLSVAGDSPDPSWWAGHSSADQSELTDAAVDWIESVANGELD
ncbi:hypothetical protein ACFULT_03275 [Rhodococcus sp. NPDC057297]|jgi:hypothetical protein|uniref:hypothetical protein n=1 Tax=Rhodococcus sp. NPDC057297 TaxID=3346090 RepID=UPI00362761DC